MIISDGKTKGVKQGIGSGDLAKTVVGNWWQRQNTGVVRPPTPLFHERTSIGDNKNPSDRR